jgi:toxin CcdB
MAAMAQFDVYANPVVAARGERPYLMEIQSDLLGLMVTTVVVPLVSPRALQVRFDRLTPQITVQGQALRLSLPEIFSLPRRALSGVIANQSADRDQIVAALDHLILGI